MSKAIGIARQSKGDDASKSIEAQVARIRDYTKSEGFSLGSRSSTSQARSSPIRS